MKTKIKIITCEGWWYNDRIGQILEVTDYDDNFWEINIGNTSCLLFKSDCVILNREKKLERIVKNE